MRFDYQARTKEGDVQSGIVEATSKEAALLLLQKYNLYVTLLEIAREPWFARRIKLFERITKRDLVLFSRQLAILFQSNVPPIESLATLASQTKNPAFREKISKLTEEVEGGTPFSQALALYPWLFSSFYVSMVKSGEVIGKLSETLTYLADHLEREYHFRSRVVSAMIYPVMVLIVFLVIFWVIIFFVMPQLIGVFQGIGQELPLVTKIAIAFSAFLKKWGWLITFGLLAIIIFIFRFRKTKEGKKFFDRFFLKLPFFGEFFKKIYLSRFAENLSTLISGGLPIAQALEITGDVIGNEIYKEIILETRERVRRGEPISAVLKRYPDVISPLFIQLLVVGEETGRVESTLMNVVNFYQKEIDRDLGILINLLEPIMIIFLGLLVGGLIASILLPLYKIGAF